MKLLKLQAAPVSAPVAPLVGAWIEIQISKMQLLALKVAPLVGAWIEIIILIFDKYLLRVAPLVGAWIEILNSLRFKTANKSLLSWERGLKYLSMNADDDGFGRSSRGSVD